MRLKKLLILCGVSAGLAGAAPLAFSNFDTNSEGWTVINNGASVNPDYHATGGNPGGYISDTDAASGPIWYFSAPAAFLGNKSAAVGGILSFNFRTTPGTFFDAPDIILIGGGLSLFASIKGLGENPNTFEPIVVEISNTQEQVGWSTGDPNEDEGPTLQQFQTVLGNLTALRIRGELISGADTASLDNVSLTASTATPEPATFAISGLGLCAAGLYRRRQRSVRSL